MAKKKKAAKKKTAKKKSAKKKSAKRAGRKPAKKAESKLLKKPAAGGKSYTKTQLVAHLTEAVNKQKLGEVNKKQVAAMLDELTAVMIKFAPVGASLPGLGKLVLKKTKRRPARMGRNPATGEEIRIPPKPAGKKLVFRVSKAGKIAAGVAKK